MAQELTMPDVHNVLAQPAIRALDGAGITSVDILCARTERELLSLHGFGQSGLRRMKQLLQEHGMHLLQDAHNDRI